MENFGVIFSMFVQIVLYMYIWIAVAIVILGVLIALIVKYIHDKKNNEIENKNKRNVIMRIIIYMVLGLLLFVLSPFIISIFL